MTDETPAPTAMIPIVCNPTVFSPKERQEHLALALDIVFRLPKRTEELADGYLFHYHGAEDLFLTLARFAHDEHRCCAWGAFSLEMDAFEVGSSGAMRLRYIAGTEGMPLLKESVEKFRAAAMDPEANRRLETAFSEVESITPENKDRFYDRHDGRV